MGDKVTSLLKGIPKGGRKLSYTVFDSCQFPSTVKFNLKETRTTLPSKDQVILRCRWNSVTQYVRTSASKRAKYLMRIEKHLRSSYVSVQDLLQLHGNLDYAAVYGKDIRDWVVRIELRLGGNQGSMECSRLMKRDETVWFLLRTLWVAMGRGMVWLKGGTRCIGLLSRNGCCVWVRMRSGVEATSLPIAYLSEEERSWKCWHFLERKSHLSVSGNERLLLSLWNIYFSNYAREQI